MAPAVPPAVRRELGVALGLFAAAVLGVAAATGWGAAYAAKAGLAMAVAIGLVARGLARERAGGQDGANGAAGAGGAGGGLGAANRVTLARLALAMLLAGAVGESFDPMPWLPWAIVLVAAGAAVLDAVDGPLARRQGRATAFGARFDMECDAWFTLVLSALVWQADRAGGWVLASGAMRYAFVAATWGWPWLAQPLAPSRRRQAVCVLQILALLVALAPVVPREVSEALCLAGLALLALSFGWDVRWLAQARARAPEAAERADHADHADRDDRDDRAGRAGRAGAWRQLAGWAVRFAMAGFVLNTLLTFESRLDAMGVHWSPRLSLELCVGVLGLTAWVAWRGRPGRRLLWALALVVTALALARYVDVTVPMVFGRPLNLYWDAPHAWQLLVLAWSSWPAAQVLAVTLAAGVAIVVVAWLAHWAVGTLAACLQARTVRPWLVAGGLLLGASFAAYPYVGADTRWFFSLPVTPSLARQVHLLAQGMSRERTEARLTPSPAFDGNLGALRGADVLLLFAESYGVTAFEQPAQSAALAGARARLAEAVRRSGRHVVSARVRSPTFGGGSWLAHAALLAGVDTRDPDDYDLLLTTRRPTLVSHFARHGWRTVGWMPGMQRPWPEGSFYGFERYADATQVGYTGPAFGYWRIPDPASMALLHAQELAAEPAATAGRPRAPRFAVFPTLQTHAPFHPLPPYLKGWERLARGDAYTAAHLAEALAAPGQGGPTGGWGPAYARALAQTFEWLGDYLEERATPGLLTLVVGDHQPLAAVSGPGASWDVPVHVISADEALLQRLRALGFVSGLDPGPRALGAMHELTGLLLRAFDMPGVDVAGTAAPTGAGRR